MRERLTDIPSFISGLSKCALILQQDVNPWPPSIMKHHPNRPSWENHHLGEIGSFHWHVSLILIKLGNVSLYLYISCEIGLNYFLIFIRQAKFKTCKRHVGK